MSVKLTDFQPFWIRLVKSTWRLGILIILMWSIPRFIMVLYASKTGNYQWVSIIFLTMWLSPWLFLTKTGRYHMGIKAAQRPIWLLYAFLLGAAGCLIMFLVAVVLYGNAISNWFVYISTSYSNLPQEFGQQDRLIYFMIYAVISMTFSPIGEELFYRGLVHHCFSFQWGHDIASKIDSAAFSIIHLAHFGLIFHQGHWQLLPIPALIWMALLFIVCLLFSYVRLKSGSILGSILAHAGFNLAMIYFIFYHIL